MTMHPKNINNQNIRKMQLFRTDEDGKNVSRKRDMTNRDVHLFYVFVISFSYSIVQVIYFTFRNENSITVSVNCL